MSNLVNKAREFAREKHAAQLRRYTEQPYFVHLEEVAALVERTGLSENAIAAALLHDAIEAICANFNPDVALMVLDLTDIPAGKGLNRAERKTVDAHRLSRASADTQSIKCADLISNTSSIVQHDPGFARLYLKEIRQVLEVLQKANDRLRQQAWASLQQAEEVLGLVSSGNRRL